MSKYLVGCLGLAALSLIAFLLLVGAAIGELGAAF